MSELVVVEEADFGDLYDDCECCIAYVRCDNCGAPDALQITDGLAPGDTIECWMCGATLEFVEDPAGGFAAQTLYCRHNRSVEENCVRCEVEGIELP